MEALECLQILKRIDYLWFLQQEQFKILLNLSRIKFKSTDNNQAHSLSKITLLIVICFIQKKLNPFTQISNILTQYLNNFQLLLFKISFLQKITMKRGVKIRIRNNSSSSRFFSKIKQKTWTFLTTETTTKNRYRILLKSKKIIFNFRTIKKSQFHIRGILLHPKIHNPIQNNYSSKIFLNLRQVFWIKDHYQETTQTLIRNRTLNFIFHHHITLASTAIKSMK